MKKLLVALSMVLLALTAGPRNAELPALPTDHGAPAGSYAVEISAFSLVHAQLARHAQAADKKTLMRKKARTSGSRTFIAPPALKLDTLAPGGTLPAASFPGKAEQPGSENRQRAPPLSV